MWLPVGRPEYDAFSRWRALDGFVDGGDQSAHADLLALCAGFEVELANGRAGGPNIPDRGFRRDVQHDGAERRAAHARVGDADHVLHAGARELHGNRKRAGLGHARGAFRAGVAQHQDVVGRDVERRIVAAGSEVLERVEDHGAAGMAQQAGGGGGVLDHGAARRQVAAQDRHAALRLLAAVSLGGAAILIAGCGNSVAPRDYKRPPSAKFYGGKGRGH